MPLLLPPCSCWKEILLCLDVSPLDASCWLGSWNVTLLLEHDCSVEVAVVPHPELGSSVLREDCVLVTTYWFVGWNTGGVEYNIGALRVELSLAGILRLLTTPQEMGALLVVGLLWTSSSAMDSVVDFFFLRAIFWISFFLCPCNEVLRSDWTAAVMFTATFPAFFRFPSFFLNSQR